MEMLSLDSPAPRALKGHVVPDRLDVGRRGILLTSHNRGQGQAGAGLSEDRIPMAFAQLVGAPHACAPRVRAPRTWRRMDGHLRSRYALLAREGVFAAASSAAGGFPLPRLPAERT